MIFGHKGRERFLDAVTGFETAVRERDTGRAEHEFQEPYQHFQEAGAQETAQAARRLAALPAASAGRRPAGARAAGPGGEQDPGPFDRVGPEAALARLTLPQWEMACVAVLHHAAVRTALPHRTAHGAARGAGARCGRRPKTRSSASTTPCSSSTTNR
ncbi:hypothetical protein [Streptomyces sp. SUK 48]|uniref:hypothetical protein n=1 Tax=Streptomyces sp. SUK 48 TaxID=2582831 RepID=UPI0031BA724A